MSQDCQTAGCPAPATTTRDEARLTVHLCQRCAGEWGDTPAGRELDARVAEKVFGWRWVTREYWGQTEGWNGRPADAPCRPRMRTLEAPDTVSRDWPAAPDQQDGAVTVTLFADVTCPAYSTDIGAAWQVVERMAAKGCAFNLNVDDEPWLEGEEEYYVALARFAAINSVQDGEESPPNGDTDARAFTAPHAICLAALKAMETTHV